MRERQVRLATVLAALLAVLLLLNWGWEPKEEIDPDATEPIWQVEADEVVHLQIERPDGQVVLAKTDAAPDRVEEIEAAVARLNPFAACTRELALRDAVAVRIRHQCPELEERREIGRGLHFLRRRARGDQRHSEQRAECGGGQRVMDGGRGT